MRKIKRKTIMPVDGNINIISIPDARRRVMVVDDDESICDIFRLILGQAGYVVDIKMDATELMEGKFMTPDLFLIDKQLSGINGLDVCRMIKSNVSINSIPVIMVSASPDIGELSVTAGAEAYIEKPFEMSHLLDMVRFFLGETDYIKKARCTS